jgi:transcriptional regulator with XRE-family HTH domain
MSVAGPTFCVAVPLGTAGHLGPTPALAREPLPDEEPYVVVGQPRTPGNPAPGAVDGRYPPDYDFPMERLAELGRALAQLRGLLGLSLESCASRLGTTAESLEAMEQGEIEPATLGDIATLYAIDEDQLRQGKVMPLEGVEGATVFLLHGAYQDFDARDLGVLNRAMRAARAVTALSGAIEGSELLQRRIQFAPVAPAGPRPADAARQGYRLARLVRAKLNLGGEPIEDMRALLEEKFGIAVVVDDLISHDLRAASILDAHRAAAAAVLAAHHPDREKNPTLARVYLAHELCHLLWDPGAPGSVRLALDDRSGLDTSGAGLLESRAKGFAAEFLIPLEGASALLGPPIESESSLVLARAKVARVREHFGTPWEIATYHLGNLGFIRQELTLDLLEEPIAPAVRHTTSLPAPAAMPHLLERLLSTHPAPRSSAADFSNTAVEVAHAPPWYVDDAQRATAAAVDDLTSRAIDGAFSALLRRRETEAVDLLVEHFDTLFLAGEFEAARRALARLDPERLPPKVLTAVLMVSAHARDKLGDARVEFFTRVQSALAERWRLPPEAIDAVARRLK